MNFCSEFNLRTWRTTTIYNLISSLLQVIAFIPILYLAENQNQKNQTKQKQFIASMNFPPKYFKQTKKKPFLIHYRKNSEFCYYFWTLYLSLTDALKDICSEYYNRMYTCEGQKWDLEHEVRKRDWEVLPKIKNKKIPKKQKIAKIIC